MTALPDTTPGSHRLDRPQRLVPAVIQALVSRIVSGEFKPNSELPKEAEIVSQYGVSRTVIREALRVLEEKDMIAIQQGRATRVRSRDSWNLLDPIVIGAMIDQDSALDVVAQLVRLRAALESDMAAAAAASQQHGSGVVGSLDKHLQEMLASTDDQERFFVVDHQFHDVIMHAAGNAFSRHIVRQVHVWTHGTAPATFGTADIERSHDEHRGIRDAIESGDADQSRSRMYDHILGSWTRKVARRSPS